MKIIRFIVGKILLFLNFVFAPKRGKRSAENKTKISPILATHILYEFKACPFCIKVRRQLRRLDLDIEQKDALNDETARKELETGGGRIKVPCLRIDKDGKTQWMYESSDINEYLTKTFPIA